MSIKAAPEERFLVQADWTSYRKLGDLLSHTRARLSYDGGRLEIMTVDIEHEHIANLMNTLLVAYLIHQKQPFIMGGGTTFRRRDKQKGFEPDGCLWLNSSTQMLGVKKWIAANHPPPDVSVEVSITHGLVDRLPILAAVGIAEVWWYHDRQVEVLRLQSDGTYKATPTSIAFPGLPPAVVADHLAHANTMLDSDIAERFHAWLRATFG